MKKKFTKEQVEKNAHTKFTDAVAKTASDKTKIAKRTKLEKDGSVSITLDKNGRV